MGFYGILMGFNGIYDGYPLVNVYIAGKSRSFNRYIMVKIDVNDFYVPLNK